jgi:hypothetical protein
MKKLKKMDISSMERELQVLQNPEKILGGGYVGNYNINGGSITNWDYDGYKYAVYTDSSGRSIVLEGVHVGGNTLPFQQDDTACYYNGQIRIGSGYNNFDFNDLMHEYGHYLQAQSMGTLAYASGAIGSAWDIFKNDGVGHATLAFEQDATNRGNAYAASYYGYPYTY